MDDYLFARSRAMIGEDGVERIRRSSVAIFGVGGVGSFTLEALARLGVGRFLIIDGDRVADSNINRQLLATVYTVGEPKAGVAARRVRSINPDAVVDARELFVTADNVPDLAGYDCVCDAVDSVTAKLAIIMAARAAGVPVVTCMGAGNKLDPTAFRVDDISRTSVCPLARVMRRELKARGIERGVRAVYSTEPPAVSGCGENDPNRRCVPASVSFVPGAAGLVMASEVYAILTRGAGVTDGGR